MGRTLDSLVWLRRPHDDAGVESWGAIPFRETCDHADSDLCSCHRPFSPIRRCRIVGCEGRQALRECPPIRLEMRRLAQQWRCAIREIHRTRTNLPELGPAFDGHWRISPCPREGRSLVGADLQVTRKIPCSSAERWGLDRFLSLVQSRQRHARPRSSISGASPYHYIVQHAIGNGFPLPTALVRRARPL